jgi:glucose-6-phosphate isomerase
VIKKNLFIKSNIPKKYLNLKYLKIFSKNFVNIINEVETEINTPDKTLHVLSNNFKFNFNIKDLYKFKKFNTFVIIGMGGSILGAEAINQFLEKKIKKKVYFFNDINSDKITDLKKKEKLNNILFLVISKSGETVETLANFFSFNIIKKKAMNIILISEKKNNTLFKLSEKYNLFYIEHKNFIGGRYSVLSEVGIVPAYLMGVNIMKIRSKLKTFLKDKSNYVLKDSTSKIASILKSGKINNLIFLNYSPRLEKFLFWCQQLIAESLGKKNKGFLPVVSNVPKDHHSLLQLYLDGPKDKLFNIFSIEENSKETIKIKKINKERHFLNNKKLNEIKEAQKKALIETLKINKIPFREYKVKTINEEVLGELFSYFILETVIISKLIKINPYDQPAVEQVKISTKRFLS